MGEALTQETIKDLVFDLTIAGEESLKRFNEPLKRLVFFKDGEIKYNERTIIEKGATEICNIQNIVVETLSVVKRSIERVYADNDGNPPVGFYVIFDDKSGLLFSSDVSYLKDKFSGEERMPVSPLFISYESIVPNSNFSIKSVLKEFFDLTRLHWNSIYFKMKTSLPLKLVQEIGEYSRREIIIPEDLSYLPL